MVGYAKMAKLLAMTGSRDSADHYYRRAEVLAVECVQALPNNTDASRDLGIVYEMRAMFMADGGEIDSALVVYGRGMKISEGLAASDPSDVLQQADVANCHFETGTILMKGHRYREAEAQFGDAYQRYGRLAVHDSSNAETRTFMARSGRQAGEACLALTSRSGAAGERARWRASALDWFEKSLGLYRGHASAAALTGDDVGAQADVSRKVEALRKAS